VKKIFALLIAIIMLTIYCLPVVATDTSYSSDKLTVSTAENENFNKYERLDDSALILSCNYSEDFNYIEIRGNVSYNVLTTYGKYRLEVLRVAPTQSIEDALLSDEPAIVASMDIASKFDLSIRIRSNEERFSKYAVILRAENKNPVLASVPQYIYVPSSYEYSSSHKGQFKGISISDTSEISISGDMGFGSVIIPVYYNRLISETSNGYMYPHEDTHCYFDKGYIDELDKKIRTYSTIGARVYLQLLLPSNSSRFLLSVADETDNEADYYMPNVYDEATASRISTYVKFLVSRYDTYSDGVVGGIVLGKQIDIANSNYNGDLSISDYAKLYSFYLTIVANSARIKNSNIDIVIPFSGFNSYGTKKQSEAGNYLPSDLLEQIIKNLDETYFTNFSYSTLIESDTMPIAVDEKLTDKNIYVPKDEDHNKIGMNNISLYEKFLSDMELKYSNVPNNYIFLWKIPSGLYGNALECSYVYNYYKLMISSKASKFIVSFDNCEKGILESVKNIVECIDTPNGMKESNKLLKHFGADSWVDIVAGIQNKNLVFRTIYPHKNSALEGYTWKGTFSYFDFSVGNINGWSGGAYSKNIKSDYGSNGHRALRQIVTRAQGEAHSDLFRLYEYDENLVHTPALRFDIEITDEAGSLGDLYEVTVTIGCDGNSISEDYVIRSGEVSQIWLNVSEYSLSNTANYIKLSSRSISGRSDEYSVWLYNMVGYSDTYDNDDLERIISEDRANIRNQTDDNNDGTQDNIFYWIVFGIIILAITIGGIMFTVIRREDNVIKVRRKENRHK